MKKFNVKIGFLLLSKKEERRIIQLIDIAIDKWLYQLNDDLAFWFKRGI